MEQFPQSRIISYPDDSSAPDGEVSVSPSQTSKFVIIQSNDQITLIFGAVSDFPYHADLVRRFCDQNEIPSGWLKKPDVYEILDNAHSVRGGGWMETDDQTGAVKFYGYSTTYGGFDAKDILYLYRDHTANNGLKLSFGS